MNKMHYCLDLDHVRFRKSIKHHNIIHMEDWGNKLHCQEYEFFSSLFMPYILCSPAIEAC